MTVAGMTCAQIGQSLEMSTRRVQQVVNSSTFQHQFALKREIVEEQDNRAIRDGDDEVVQAFKDNALKAAEKLVDHIDSSSPNISMKASTELLDRAGYAVVKNSVTIDQSHNLVISDESAKLLADVLDKTSPIILKSESNEDKDKTN